MFHTSTPLPTRMAAHSHIKQALVAGGICALALATAAAWSQTTPAPAMGTASASAPADASKLVSADSRHQGDPDQLQYCGAGAISLQDRENFAILMRVALLSSLSGTDSTKDLGFRCARSLAP